METNRKADSKCESAVAQFMDRHFWPRISRMCAQSFERVKDVKRQVHGIDVVIGRAYVDEKAKVRGCLNKPVQNLAFELGFKGRDCAWHDGWLCNPAMATTHYAVIDVFTEKELGEKALPGLSDISKVNVLLFKKSDLWKRALRDMPLCLLMSKVEDMRWTSQKKIGLDGCLWLTQSFKFAEQPINLVVPRGELEVLPSAVRYEAGPGLFREISDIPAED